MPSPSPLLAVIADVHLTPTGSAWVGSAVTGDAHASLRYFSEWCRDHACDGAGAGDLFDKATNRSAVLSLASDAIFPFDGQHIVFHHVKGNHDADTPPWMTFVPGAKYAAGRVISLRDGMTAFALDYAPKDELADALATIPPGTDVLIAHQAWAEWNRNPGAAQGALKDVPHVRYVISGDDHVPRADTITRDDGSTLVAISPGSAALQAINEPPEKFFVVLWDDGTSTFEELPSRPVVPSEILGTDDAVAAFFRDLPGVVAAATAAERARVPAWYVDGREPSRPIVNLRYRANVAKAAVAGARESSHVAHFVRTRLPAEEPEAYESPIEYEDTGRVGLVELLPRIVRPGTFGHRATLVLLTEAIHEGDLVATARGMIDELVASGVPDETPAAAAAPEPEALTLDELLDPPDPPDEPAEGDLS